MKDLIGKKVAILVANGFEQVEYTRPRQALEDAGADITVISPEQGRVRGWNRTEWGDTFEVDASIDSASADDYDALVVPGGQMSPDFLRINDNAVKLVKDFFTAGKPVAAICHGPWLLAEAGVVAGRRVTSYRSIKTDLINAGADWIDEPAVTDSTLVTSRQPDDIPAFNDAMINAFAEGRHEVARPV